MIFYIGSTKEEGLILIKINNMKFIHENILSVKIPLMKSLRVDYLTLDKINLTLLVDQETNDIYYSKIYERNDKLKNVYSEFKYRACEMMYFDFYIPLDMKCKVKKIDNRIKYNI